MKKMILKTMLISLGLEGLTRFYGLFAHGVTSIAMESMPLVAIGGGVILLILLKMIPADAPYMGWFKRSFITALAFLINDLFIEGVLTIAGGTSSYAVILLSISAMFWLISAGIYSFILIRKPMPDKKNAEV